MQFITHLSLSDNIALLYFWKQKCSSCLRLKIKVIREVLPLICQALDVCFLTKIMTRVFSGLFWKQSNSETNCDLSSRNIAFLKELKKKNKQPNNNNNKNSKIAVSG